MQITKELLLARIDAYRKDEASIRRQADMTIAALQGAIKDCEHWIAELDKAEAKAEGDE